MSSAGSLLSAAAGETTVKWEKKTNNHFKNKVSFPAGMMIAIWIRR